MTEAIEIPSSSTQSSTTSTRPYLNRTSLANILKAVSSVFIPMMIGIFTIVLALQQHQLGIKNRQNDLAIAEEQRKEEARRRQHDLNMAVKLHMDNVFSTYITEMCQLLLTDDSNRNRTIRYSIIRAKTLIVLRQIDTSRKLLVIQFLFEIGLIQSSQVEKSSEILSEADLQSLRLGNEDMETIRLRSYSFLGALLNNATFVKCDLIMVVFERTQMKHALFRRSNFASVDFYRATLTYTKFYDVNFFRIDFSMANLTGSNIEVDRLIAYDGLINGLVLPNGTRLRSQNLLLTTNDSSICLPEHWSINPVEQVTVVDQNCTFSINASRTHSVSMKIQISLLRHRVMMQRNQAVIYVFADLISSKRNVSDLVKLSITLSDVEQKNVHFGKTQIFITFIK